MGIDDRELKQAVDFVNNNRNIVFEEARAGYDLKNHLNFFLSFHM